MLTTAGRVRQGRVALATLCCILFLTFLDNTIVSVALGDVQSALHAGVSQLQWVVNGYAVVFASLMLAAGMLGDQLGRKRVMVAGAVVFCAGSVVCAVAPTVTVLIVGRAVMGLGAAASEPGTLSMIRQLYPDRAERARVLGFWAAVAGLALALGPVIGGVLVGIGGWRAIFWFNVVFGLAACVAAMAVLPESADPQAGRVDAGGALLGASALAAAAYAVIHGETAGYRSASVIALFAIAALAAALFAARERRARHPLLDLTFLRRPKFTVANVVAFANYFATFALFFFTALYLTVVVGDSGFRIALLFLPMTVLMIGASVAAGRWTARSGPRVPMAGGSTVFGVGLLLTAAVLSRHPSYLPLAVALAVSGVGLGFAAVPVTAAVLSAVPADRSGMAASATNTSREIGAVTGVAVLGAVVNGRLTGQLLHQLRHLGIPSNFFSLVINAVEHGGLPGGSQAGGGANQKLVQQVTDAAYGAFHAGLHLALIVSAVLVLVAAGVAAVSLRPAPDQAISSPSS